jgi:hypothetical protein
LISSLVSLPLVSDQRWMPSNKEPVLLAAAGLSAVKT